MALDPNLAARLTDEQLDDENLVRLLEGVGPPPPIDPADKRGTKLNEARQEWLCDFISVCPSPKLAGEILGLSVSTIHKHRRQDPGFRARYDEAAADGRSLAASLAYELAYGIGKSYEVVRTKGGAEVIAVPARRSERMVELIYKLENAPEFQRHTHDVNVNGVEPGSLIIHVTGSQLAKLSRQERRQLTYLLQKVETSEPTTIEGSSHQILPRELAHETSAP